MLFPFVFPPHTCFVGNHYRLELEICIHWSMTDPRCQNQILDSPENLWSNHFIHSFSMRGWVTGVFRTCGLGLLPNLLLFSATPYSLLEGSAFPSASCHPYAVSTDLWGSEKKERYHNSKSHFSAVKDDSWLKPVFTGCFICPAAAATAVAALTVPSLCLQWDRNAIPHRGIPQGASRPLL